MRGSELGLGYVRSVLSGGEQAAGASRRRFHTLYASWAAVAATLRFSPDANSAR